MGRERRSLLEPRDACCRSMSIYSTTATNPPKSLTELELRLLLAASGCKRDDYRDHVVFSLALGTGLREHEIAALNCGDVVDDTGAVRQRVVLKVFKRSGDDAEQEVVLPDLLRAKLGKYLSWKRWREENCAPASPLFLSRNHRRLSTRQLRHLFHLWHVRAGFDRRLGFQALRHTACSILYRSKDDIRLTQRFARHRSVVTTAIYAHPSDDDLVKAVRNMQC
jgi:integrase/recombinase XerC